MQLSLAQIIENIVEGYSEVSYQDKRYGLTKKTVNAKKSYKVFAQELAGNDFISLNFYRTKTADLLKPCEMPDQKVIDFLQGFKLID